MEKEIVHVLNKRFDDYANTEGDVEYWLARELQELLGYSKWSNFLNAIEKAKESCKTTGLDVPNHFADVSKKVKIGSETEREIDDIMLTRYACYLIAQNGDPRKEEIAFAQSYFAIQTRKQEILEERISLIERITARKKLVTSETELSKLIYERGVDNRGFGRIRSKGDSALFGGYSTKQIKRKFGTPSNRPLADFLPSITIKAKDLATEITNFNVKKLDLRGENAIAYEHIKDNKDVRTLLGKSGIKPEELPPEEDIKKLERRVSRDEKLLAKGAKSLKCKKKQ